MRWIMFSLLVVAFWGCHYGPERIKGYMDSPASLLEDPLTVSFESALEDLERSYLRKEITYAEYIEKKRDLESTYSRDVQKRETYD